MKKEKYLQALITTQAVIKNENGAILLLKRNKKGGWFTLPGGTLHQGEKANEGLERELLEETGLNLNVGRPLWIWQSNHIGKDLLGIVFDTNNILKENITIRLSSEHNEFGWFTLEKLFDDETVDPYIKQQELKELLKDK